MGVTIFNSGSAMMSLGELNKNINKTSQVLAKLSTGEKVNQAKDGASEYAISEKMRAEVRSIEQDGENVQNGSSVVKIAEGAVEDIVENLRSLRELAINAATDTNTDEDRKIIQKTFDSTIETINDVVYQAKFNGMSLIDGSFDSRAEPDALTIFWGKSDAITNENGVAYSTLGETFDATTDDDGNETYPNVYTINKDGVYEFPADLTEGGIIVIGANVHNLKFTGTVNSDPAPSISIEYATGEAPSPLNISNEVTPTLTGLPESTEDAPEFNPNRSAPMQIQNGTEANQSIALIMADMHIDKLQSAVPNSSDIEHLNTLESPDYEEYQNFLMKAKDMTLKDVSLLTRDDARTALRVIESAIEYALDQATTLGAYSKRLDYNLANIDTYNTNLQAADSTIRDADMAREMTELTKSNILQQSSQAMLAQANQQSSQILSLLQG